MKLKYFFLLTISAMVVFTSCKKDETTVPQVVFSNNIAEGTANNTGAYTITGNINSAVRLDKVVLTKEGQTAPFLVDESTAKNKNNYDFSYDVTGITANTYIIIDVYDQSGGKTTLRFLIKK